MIYRSYKQIGIGDSFLTILKTAFTPPNLRREKGHITVTYADNFFLPFARLAAKTFLPPGVLILALKP